MKHAKLFVRHSLARVFSGSPVETSKYYANHLLVTWDWRHYFWATILAIIAVFIASYVPARRAPRLERVRCAAGEISRQIQFATARPLPPLLIASFPGL